MTKKELLQTLDTLSPEALAKVENLVRELLKAEGKTSQRTVQLKGLWKGMSTAEEEIATMRREVHRGTYRLSSIGTQPL
jgi:hypothetical protein